MGRTQPKYQRLNELLLDRIAQSEWRPGDRLPSERQIAEEYGVAYMTVRNAVSRLVQTGQLRRIRGRGTFVVEPDEPDRRPSLGLLLTPNWHSLDPFYFPPIVTGFVEKANELGYQAHLADRTEPLLEFLRFRELHVSAVACVLLGREDLVDADALLDRGVLVVAINHYGGARRIPAVSPDNRGGAYQAARHLVALGHRRFAFLEGPEGNLDAHERLRGVQIALREAQIPLSALTLWPGGFLEDSGYERGLAMLARGSLPSAVISVSDLAAIGLLKAFAENGIRCPDDVSVFGFGDFRLSAYLTPALTTVRLPLRDLGVRAAEALVAQCHGVRLDPVRLDCPLVFRDSVAAPSVG
ncbi:MAG: GntR family transcriptional regulator [Fimbriimonadaceae bacterium]|nr:GntR family transcriptional regulator [Fimbriimonadaceae bacterium]